MITVVPSVTRSATNLTGELKSSTVLRTFREETTFRRCRGNPGVILLRGGRLLPRAARVPICNTRFTSRRNSLKASRGPAAIL